MRKKAATKGVFYTDSWWLAWADGKWQCWNWKSVESLIHITKSGGGALMAKYQSNH